MVWSADGRLEATGSVDGLVKVWTTSELPGSGQLLATLEGDSNGVASVALSADGQWVAGGGHDGTVKVWHAKNGQEATICMSTAAGFLPWR